MKTEPGASDGVGGVETSEGAADDVMDKRSSAADKIFQHLQE